METLVRDLRYGLRMLARTPAVTAVAVLALALGIGANTAIFSVVYAVLLRPFPVEHPERLISINPYNPRFNIPPINSGYGSYAEWKRQAGCFENMAAANAGAASFSIGSRTEHIKLWRISASFLPTLGVRPAFGRGILPEEDQPGTGRVALLSYTFWQRVLGADAAAVGKSVTIDNNGYTVVGVLPAGFHVDGKPADVYAPIALNPADRKVWLPVSVYARLKPGVAVRQAEAEMDTIAQRLDRSHFGWRARVWTLRESMVHDVRLSLLVLLGAVALVLLIACANIASLMLAKASARQREIAIRAALGAGRRRLLRQLLTESTLLSLVGGAAGVLLASWSIRLVPLIQNERLPNLLGQTRIDSAVLAFTVLISVATGLLFGTAPALGVSQSEVHNVLKEGGRSGESVRRRRMWNFLVVSETALALLLLIGSTLLIRSFFYLRDDAPGFRVQNLFVAKIAPAKEKYPQPEQRIAFYREVLDRVRSIPGVEAAALSTTLPQDGEFASRSDPLEGHQFTPQNQPVLWWRNVDAEYLRTLGIPLVAGRAFTAQDRPGGMKVAIINETMARRYWPSGAVGKHIGNPRGSEYYEIVGVAADVRHHDSTKDNLLEVLFAYQQAPSLAAKLAVRVNARVYRDPVRIAPLVARAVASVDKDVAPAETGAMQQIVSDRLAAKRLSAGIIAAFAGLALVLAAIGIYGVLAFSVAQRTHEIGLRLALGAARTAVIGMVVRQATILALAGIALGVAAALALTRVMASLIYGVSATDGRIFAAASLVLLAVSVLAAWLPAHRAARVDPMVALRHE